MQQWTEGSQLRRNRQPLHLIVQPYCLVYLIIYTAASDDGCVIGLTHGVHRCVPHITEDHKGGCDVIRDLLGATGGETAA